MTQSSSTPSGADPVLSQESVYSILRVARSAPHVFPGPVGELIAREMRAYIHAGRQLPPDTLPERLLAVLLPIPEAAQAAAISRPEYALPARYRKGSPLHWDYDHTPSPAAPTADAE